MLTQILYVSVKYGNWYRSFFLDLIKARSPYPECEKKQCGDACSLGGLIGQCNEHRMCIFGGKPPNCGNYNIWWYNDIIP